MQRRMRNCSKANLLRSEGSISSTFHSQRRYVSLKDLVLKAKEINLYIYNERENLFILNK